MNTKNVHNSTYLKKKKFASSFNIGLWILVNKTNEQAPTKG